VTSGDEAPGPDADALDRLLLEAASRGDARAFEGLVRRHTPALYRLALRVTGSAPLAEDAVQDAWLSAWVSLAGFRGDAAVRTWLFRVASTRAMNVVRRPPPAPVDLAAQPDLVTAPDAAAVAATEAQARAVREAVAALPGRQRDAVVLRDLEGLSYEEVARALHCSVPAVKSALHRGRGALAEALAPWRSPG